MGNIEKFMSFGSTLSLFLTTLNPFQITAEEEGAYFDFGQHTENYETFEPSDDTKYYHEDAKPEWKLWQVVIGKLFYTKLSHEVHFCYHIIII